MTMTAFAVYAVDPSQSTHADWRTIGTAAIGVAVMLVGAYAKGVERRVENNERDIKACLASTQQLRELVLSEYQRSEKLNDVLAPMHLQFNELKIALREVHEAHIESKLQLAALHQRLDSIATATATATATAFAPRRHTPNTRTGD